MDCSKAVCTALGKMRKRLLIVWESTPAATHFIGSRVLELLIATCTAYAMRRTDFVTDRPASKAALKDRNDDNLRKFSAGKS